MMYWLNDSNRRNGLYSPLLTANLDSLHLKEESIHNVLPNVREEKRCRTCGAEFKTFLEKNLEICPFCCSNRNNIE